MGCESLTGDLRRHVSRTPLDTTLGHEKLRSGKVSLFFLYSFSVGYRAQAVTLADCTSLVAVSTRSRGLPLVFGKACDVSQLMPSISSTRSKTMPFRRMNWRRASNSGPSSSPCRRVCENPKEQATLSRAARCSS